MAQQFDSDLICNDNDRIVESWVTVETTDKQGDIIKVDDLYKAMLKAQERGIPINDAHSNRFVGKVLNFFQADHPSNKKGIKAIYKIFSDYEFENKVWAEIKSGKRKGLSIGGISYGKETMKDETGKTVRVPTDIALFEVSSVYNPANPLALNESINYFAKGEAEKFPIDQVQMGIKVEMEHTDDPMVALKIALDHLKESKEYYTKLKEMESTFKDEKKEDVVQKPFADYKDFDDCVRRNSDKGDPKAYCATIMRQVEGKSDDSKNNEGGKMTEEIKNEASPPVEKKMEEKKPEDKKEEPKEKPEEKKKEDEKPGEKKEPKEKKEDEKDEKKSADKLDKAIAILEKIAGHFEKMEKSAVVEKKVEVAATTETVLEKKEGVEIVKSERPSQTEIRKDVFAKEDKGEDDLALQIARGKVVNLRKMEEDKNRKHEEKMKKFLDG